MAIGTVYLQDPRALLCLEIAENPEETNLHIILYKILENFSHAVDIKIYID